MTNTPAGGTRVQLTPRLALLSPPGQRVPAHVLGDGPAVLGADDDPLRPTAPLADFVPAEPPVVLDVPPAPSSGPSVLGPESEPSEIIASVDFQPDPAEGAVYVLLHEIHTPDGILYDVTLPEAGTPAVLGADNGILRFPVHRLTGEDVVEPHSIGGPDVLGVGDVVAGVAGKIIFKHVLHLLRAPVEHALVRRVAQEEGQPVVLAVNADGSLGVPISNADAWRSRFTPGKEHRVLIYVHGFLSSAANSLPAAWVKSWGQAYDAVLAYNHPTISRDPAVNALDLLQMLPDDLRLNVDLVAHSRGGLVARSLVELQPATDKLAVRRLLTCGTPHDGTRLADHERWDRLVSIAMSGMSWLTTATGAGASIAFIPKLVEYLLRAASQFVFDLPGVEAMNTTRPNAFLDRLNMPGAPTLADRVRYAAVVSTFAASDITQTGFRDALRSLAAQAFMRIPNDLIVPTESMRGVDLPGADLLGGRVFQTNVNHFSYFIRPDIQDFARDFLLDQS